MTLACFQGGVVLHLAVEHHRAGPVRHRLDDPHREGDFRRIGGEDALGDGDLVRMQGQAPAQPMRKALRNWASQASPSEKSPNGP